MTALREAVERLRESVAIVLDDGQGENLGPKRLHELAAAARALLDAPEAWWCETHESSADDPPMDFPHFCLGEMVNGHDGEGEVPTCRMVRVRIVPEAQEDRG